MTSKDNRADVRDFLASRRGRISPEQAGLPPGGRRRVPGLRREEVAVLAGVSTEWYTRLEKGHIAGVSEDVLVAVARALRLDDEERTYLFDLARAARPSGRLRGCRGPVPVPPQVQWMLDAMTMSAAVVTNGRWDVLADNALARALYAPMLANGTNVARYHFLDPGARHFYADWEAAATTVVALLRAEASRYPCDEGTRELVAEMGAASPEFRSRWAAHDILLRNHGTKTFRHPVAGPIELAYHSMELPTSADAPHLLTTYTAEPGSAAEDQLRFLASWATEMSDTMTPS
ncbi:helix-turn-helix transcriptional regulator [Actinoplanes awajinensis]|uniref:XRE family transcriptional regulator n=1 Tax=Actinoplanes awajinensis subsp. mycoplanecinus TaxID=135947 RepID=A0A0X3V831_9ACTN|nr:helix-turn-helix transcriptional regulator [Actinoplanes awajinensis]KUL40890.1 XRE family transcriptional regulator [Actinoplanes awajinensis subsp. mycoplanecinus]